MTRWNNHDNGEARANKNKIRRRAKVQKERKISKAAAALLIKSLQIHADEIAIHSSTSNTEFRNFQALAPEKFITSENDRDEEVSTGKYNIFNAYSESTFNFQIHSLFVEEIHFENLCATNIDQNISTISSVPPTNLSAENHHMTLACATASILSTNSAAEERYDHRTLVTEILELQIAQHPSALLNSNFEDTLLGLDSPTSSKQDISATPTSYPDLISSDSDYTTTPHDSDFIRIPQEVFRGSKRKHGEWLLNNLQSDKPILEYRRSLIKNARHGIVTTRHCGGIPKGFAVPMEEDYEEIHHTHQAPNSEQI